jgi:hypothetical protein
MKAYSNILRKLHEIQSNESRNTHLEWNTDINWNLLHYCKIFNLASLDLILVYLFNYLINIFTVLSNGLMTPRIVARQIVWFMMLFTVSDLFFVLTRGTVHLSSKNLEAMLWTLLVFWKRKWTIKCLTVIEPDILVQNHGKWVL